MPTPNFADLSRQPITRTDAPEPTIDDLKLGTLQRLATAVESLALKHERPSRLAQAIEAFTGREKSNEINMLKRVNQGLHSSLEEREQSVRKAWHEVHLMQDKIATLQKEAQEKTEPREVVFDTSNEQTIRILKSALNGEVEQNKKAWAEITELKSRIEQYQALENELRRQINTARDDGYDDACNTIGQGLNSLMTTLEIDGDAWGDDAAPAAVISDMLHRLAGCLAPLPIKYDPDSGDVVLMDQGSQDKDTKPQHWTVTKPGQADQYRAEAKTCRTLLGLDRDAEYISPVDLRERFDEVIRLTKKGAAELEMANANEVLAYLHSAVDALRASVGMSPYSPQEGDRKGIVLANIICRIAADLEALPVWFMSSDQSLHIAPNHPEDQDEDKPQRERGLYQKYHVERVDGAPMPEGAIVLEWSDPSARHGISAYSSAVREDGYTAFADDLDEILRGYWGAEGDPRGADAGDAPLIQLGFTNQAQIDCIEQGETGLFFPSMKEGRTIPLYTRSSVNYDHPGASTTAVDDQDKEDQA